MRAATRPSRVSVKGGPRRRRRGGHRFGPVGSTASPAGREQVDERPGPGRPDAVVQSQQPEPGQLVVRVVQQPDGGRRSPSRAQPRGSAGPRTCGTGRAGRRARSRSGRCGARPGRARPARARRTPALVGIEDPVGDGPGLGRGVMAPHQDRAGAPRAGRLCSMRRDARLGGPDDVGEVQDRLHGPEVALRARSTVVSGSAAASSCRCGRRRHGTRRWPGRRRPRR